MKFFWAALCFTVGLIASTILIAHHKQSATQLNTYLIAYQGMLPDGRTVTGNHVVKTFAFYESDIPIVKQFINEAIGVTNANVIILNVIKLDK